MSASSRGELVRDRPARRARDKAELALQLDVVDFVDHAVDLVRQRRARHADVAKVRETPLDGLDHARLRTDLESEAAQHLEHLAVMAGHLPALDVTNAVDEQIQGARRRHSRVELPQTPGRRVARIDESLLAARQRLAIEALESRERHEYFAAHLEHPRQVRDRVASAAAP